MPELAFLGVSGSQECEDMEKAHAYTFCHLSPEEMKHAQAVHQSIGLRTKINYEIFKGGNAFILDPWSASLNRKTAANDIEKLLSTLFISSSKLINGTLNKEEISEKMEIILQNAENGSYLQTQFGSITYCNSTNLMNLWNKEISFYSGTKENIEFPIELIQKIALENKEENLNSLLNTSYLMSYFTALNSMIEEYASLPGVLTDPETIQDLKIIENEIKTLKDKYMNKQFSPSEVKKEFLLINPLIKDKVILESFL